MKMILSVHLRSYLSIGILVTALSLQGSDNGEPTPEQIVAILSQSDNPVLAPLQSEINALGDRIQRIRMDRRGGNGSDDAPGVAQLSTSTPASTPVKQPLSRTQQRRPTPMRMPSHHDTGVGIGNLDLSNFESVPDAIDVPNLEEEIAGIQRSIGKLETVSAQLLNNANRLTEQEQEALRFIRAKSKQALYADSRVVTAAALGIGLGAFAWAASINPFRIYKDNCTKFTGLEMPALVAAGKALIGPVIAIIGIGIIWYKFKQWIVEPYKEAHKAELQKLNEALAKHKTEVHQALMVTQQQAEETHQETVRVLDAMRHAMDKQLGKVEQSTRQQLEHTIKTLTATEAQLRDQILGFTSQATQNLAAISGNIQDLQHSRDDLRIKTDQLLTKHAEILALLQTLKNKEAELSQTIKTVRDNQVNIVRIMDKARSTSPASAPVGRASSPGTSKLQEPQSAGTQKSKRTWFRRGSQVAPEPLPSSLSQPLGLTVTATSPSPSEHDSKRSAAVAAPLTT